MDPVTQMASMRNMQTGVSADVELTMSIEGDEIVYTVHGGTHEIRIKPKEEYAAKINDLVHP